MINDIISVPYHDIDPIDLNLAKTISETLERHYPGWAWQVNVNSEGGVVNVINGVLNDGRPANYGYVLHIANLNNYKDVCHKAVMVGGELLERYNMPREGWKGQEPTSMEIH